jgi:hypothetical protein
MGWIFPGTLPVVWRSGLAVALFCLSQMPGAAQGQMVTDHARYYPERVAVYMELNSPEAMAYRVFSALDHIAASKKKPAASNLKLVELLDEHLETRVSWGVWDLGAAPLTGQMKSIRFLVVGELKPQSSLKALAEELSEKSPPVETLGEGQYSMISLRMPPTAASAGSKSPPASPEEIVLLQADRHLLVTNDLTLVDRLPAIDALITPPMLKNKLLKDHLHRLPDQRQGTFFVLNKYLSPEGLALQPDVSALIEKEPGWKEVLQYQEDLQKAVPGTLAAILMEGDTLVRMSSYVPMDLEQVKDPAFRQDFKAIMLEQPMIDVSTVLPDTTALCVGMANVSGLLRMSFQYFLPQSASFLKQSQAQSQKMLDSLQLDWQKNILSLFDRTTALALALEPDVSLALAPEDGSGIPMVALLLNDTPDVRHTLQVASQLLEAEVAEKTGPEGQELTVLRAKKGRLAAAYAGLLPHLLGVSSEAGVKYMLKAPSGEVPTLATSARYQNILRGHAAPPWWTLFYVDGPNLQTMLSRFFTRIAKESDTPPPAGAQKFVPLVSQFEMFNGLEGIAVTQALEGEKMIRLDATLRLTPRQP